MTVPLNPVGVRPSLAELLFTPRSVALYGASDDVDKVGARPLTYLTEAGWDGRIYPVNPRRQRVLGHRAWSSLAELPEVPDHVFVLTDSDRALDAARECAALGVPLVTVVASGFAEAGVEGRRRQAELAHIAATSATRVLGPSSLGVVDLRSHLLLTANAAFAEADLPVGDVFVASQSGSVIGALVSRGKEMGLGFAGLVSTGGEVDLSLGEICSATLDVPGIASYALFLESLTSLDALRAFSLGAADRGRPVVAYKLGSSAVAAKLAVSHTGALAGEDIVAEALLADLGIARVHTFEALLEGQLLATHVPLPTVSTRAARVGVVTTTGGGGAMIIDQLALRGCEIVGPSAETRRRLAEIGVVAGPSVLVDLTLTGTRYDVMKGALDVLLSAPEFQLVVAVAGSSARHRPELTVRPIIDSVATGTPLAAFVVPDAPDALRLLRGAGVPAFRTPESCADAVAAVFSRRRPRPRPAVSILDRGRTTLDEEASARVLAKIGVPFAPHVVLELGDPPAALPFPGPIVVKALAADLPHKSDAGGVVVGVRDVVGLAGAMTGIAQAVEAATGLRVTRFLAQPMVEALGEVLVGYRHDPTSGPMVMLAAGGVTAELYADRTLRPAPIDRDTALEMIAQVVGLKALAGYRGGPVGDLDALADVVVALSLLGDPGGRGELPDIVEAEVNPLMVLPVGQGVLAVDGLVVVSGPVSPGDAAKSG